MIDPTYIGVLKSFGHNANGRFVGGEATVTSPSLARACHTISAWQTYSGNMPITLLSNAGKSMVKRDMDLYTMTQNARDIVKSFFSNEFWCNLYDVQIIKNQFLCIYNQLSSIMSELESPTTAKQTYNQEELLHQKLTRKLFEVFDDTLSMVYKSLTEISYPKFVKSDIGEDLKQRLTMEAETREQFGTKIL